MQEITKGVKELKSGIHKPIICRKCGHRVGTIKLKPELLELIKAKNRKQTWFYIFLIALVTQFISQIISDVILKYAYN